MIIHDAYFPNHHKNSYDFIDSVSFDSKNQPLRCVITIRVSSFDALDNFR